MRKRGHRQPGLKTPPMLVMRGLVNDRVELEERVAVQALIEGWAEPYHFDKVVDMQGVLLLAGATSDERRWARDYARYELGPVIERLRKRHDETGKFKGEGADLDLLRGFVGKYRDFWLRQPHGLYECAVEQLQKFYDERAAAKRRAA